MNGNMTAFHAEKAKRMRRRAKLNHVLAWVAWVAAGGYAIVGVGILADGAVSRGALILACGVIMTTSGLSFYYSSRKFADAARGYEALVKES